MQSDLAFSLDIVTPCSASWDEMEGDERKRFCASCALPVHNIAALSRREVRRLVSQKGRVCGRLHRTADGSVLVRGGSLPNPSTLRRTANVALLAASMTVSACGEDRPFGMIEIVEETERPIPAAGTDQVVAGMLEVGPPPPPLDSLEEDEDGSLGSKGGAPSTEQP